MLRRGAATSPALVALLLATLVIGAACGGDDPLRTGVADPAKRVLLRGLVPEAGSSTTGEAVALRALPGLLAGVPIVDGDFADPFVLRSGRSLYGYSTNTADAQVPVFRLTLGRASGEYLGDALESVPAWSEPGSVWAPAVSPFGDGYVLYYSTRVAGTTMQCLSSAYAEEPSGPFMDDTTEPIVCQRELGGTIDPSVVTDPAGDRWLLFKNDGNCCGLPTSIWSARLSGDGRSVDPEHHRLLTANAGWEGELIEGPSMIVRGDDVHLFYSANAWDSERYAIGVASCESVTGPCRRESEEPWRSSTRFARGPGGQEFFDALGDRWMIYHGWAAGDPVRAGGQRRLFVDIVGFRDGHPVAIGRSRVATTIIVVSGVVVVAVTLLVARRRRRRRRRSVEPDRQEAP